jgi:hypothetical protein
MNTPPTRFTDERLKEAARRFRYPPTPDMTGVVIDRIQSGSRPGVRMRSVWTILSLALLLVLVLFAVPGVRAEIVRFFQVGVVRIIPPASSPTVIPSLPQMPITATPAGIPLNTTTPQPNDTPSGLPHEFTLADIAGETTLEDAQARTSFSILLPEYPADLGAPDQVFLQEDGLMVILVWTDPADPEKARLSLHEIGPGSILVKKFEPRVIQESRVNGHYAVWAEGPYLVQLTNGSIEFRQMVEGNTLIWEENDITYRLASNLSLEEAIKIAESLK